MCQAKSPLSRAVHRRKTENSLNIRIIRPGDAPRLGQHSVGSDIAVRAANIRVEPHGKEDTSYPAAATTGPTADYAGEARPATSVPAPRTMIM
jgi:hypothetical protein